MALIFASANDIVFSVSSTAWQTRDDAE